MPKTHSPYAPEYRRQMVGLVRSGRTPGELALEFECSASAIRNWVRQADRDEGRREDGLTSSELEELRRLRRDNRQLRARTRDTGKSYGLVRSGDRLGPGEVLELVKANQAHHRVATMCRMLGVSPSGYYAWRSRGRSNRAKREEALRGTIRAIHEVSGGTYGAPRVHAEMMAGGCRMSRNRVARLMREAGLAGVSRRRGMRTTRVDQSHCVVPDRVERQFQADAPDRLWVADVTYVPTWTGFVYLAIVLDVFTRWVGGMVHDPPSSHRTGARGAEHGVGTAPPPKGSYITPTRARSTPRLPLGSGAGRWGWFRRPGRPGIASTTPWPRACSPRWSASSSTGVRSVPRPKRAWRSSNSSKAGTTHAVVIRPWVTSAPTTSNAPWRRKRHVQCATLIVRLEPSPVLPGAASQRSRHTPRECAPSSCRRCSGRRR